MGFCRSLPSSPESENHARPSLRRAGLRPRLWLGLLWLLGGLASLAAQDAATTVMVDGAAAEGVPNVEAALRTDAMRQALTQVAGTQVNRYAITASQQLLADYTFAQVDGFVEAAEAMGTPRLADGVWTQRFRVRVRAGDLNRELVSREIDVQFLYETVARPRIAIAVTESWQPEVDGAWVERPGQFSVARIGEYFKSRHPDFDLRDLDLLRVNQGQEVDYVREARANQFDYLVVGETRLSRRAMPAAGDNPWTARAGDPAAGAARHAFAAALEWRVVEVATARTVFTLQDKVEPDATALRGVASREAAADWARTTAVDAQTPVLFRRLLAQWNREAFNRSWEIVLRGAELDLLELGSRLRERSGLEASSVTLRGAARGEAVFAARTSLGNDEQVAAVGTALGKGFRLADLRTGRMVFEQVGVAGGAATAGVRVRLEQVRFADARAIATALEGVRGVVAVERGRMSGGVSELLVRGTAEAEELAIAAEEVAPERVRVIELGEDLIVLSAEDSK